MSSVAQIIRKIIDDLSDGVSQLVLLVVVLQEKNAEVPPQLPQAAGVVNQTAGTLAKIAKQLAEANYKEHPSIAAEIVDAANTVEKAVAILEGAVATLQTSPKRQAGWEGLVEACRVMAGKTIRLLEIVYGAELKRLFAEAEAILESLKNFSTDLAQSDPQAFADLASDIGSRAANMANHLMQRANDEESPLLREQLQRKAEEINQAANEFINAVNDLLQDPENPEAIKRVNDAAERLRQLMDDTTGQLKSAESEVPSGMEAVLPSIDAVKASRQPNITELIAQMSRAGLGGEPSPLTHQIAEAKQNANNVVDAAVRRDAQGLIELMASSQAKLDELSRLADEFAGTDASKRAQVQNTIAELKRLLPQQIQAARSVIQDPENKQKQEELNKVTNSINDLLDQLAEETRPNQIASNTKKAQRTLEDINEHIRTGNKAGIDALLKDLSDIKERISQEAATYGPGKLTELSAALNDLENMIQHLRNDVNSGNTAQVSKDIKDLRDQLEALAKKANAESIAAADRTEADLHRVAIALRRNDPAGVKRTAKVLGADGKALIEAARAAAAAETNVQRRQEIVSATNITDAAMRNVLSAVQAYLADPDNPATKARLVEEQNRMQQAIDQLRDVLKGHPAGARDTLKDSVNDTLLAQSTNDAKKQLEELADLLARASKGDADAARRLAELADEIDRSTSSMATAVVNQRPEDEIFMGLSDLKNALRNLDNAVKRQDGQGAVVASRALIEAFKPLLERIRAEANNPNSNLTPEQRQQLLKMADDIERLLPTVLRNAKEAISNPAEYTKFNNSLNDLKRIVERATDIVSSPYDEKSIHDGIKDVISDMNQVREAARKGDVKGAEEAAKKVQQKSLNIIKSARRHLPPSEDDPMKELKAVWDRLLPAARKAAENPTNKPAHDDLDNVLKGFEHGLHNIEAKTHAAELSPFQDASEALDRLVDAVDRRDTQGISKSAQDLIQAAGRVVERINNETDNKKKQVLTEALGNINDQIKGVLESAKGAASDPENRAKNATMKSNVAQTKANLARGLNAIATDPARSLNQHIQQGHSDLANVKAANQEGNVGRVSAAIKKFEETAAKAQQEAQRVATLEKNPERKKHIEAAAAKLQQSAQALAATTPSDKDSVAHNTNKAEDALNDLAQAAKGDDKQDALDTRAKIRGLVAAMKAAQASGDLNGLLDAATELGRLLRSLIGDTTSLAKSFAGEGLSEKAKTALDIDALLSSIENQSTSEPSVESIDKLLGSLQSLQEAIKPKPQPVAEPKTFEDVVDKVAQDIRDKVEETEIKYQEATNVADALSALATAARKGQRQPMMLAGRAVATHITAIEKELRAIAQRVGNKNPTVQDKLIRYAQALRNYSTQLKILTSVKAASIEQNTDADESLTSITRSLGSVLSDALGTIDVAKIAVLKEESNPPANKFSLST